MSLYITSLNSGSNGNCYYIGNDNEAVLVDAGLSCKETEKRMARLNLPMSKVKAIFVSHEHTDHVKGLAGLADKYLLPVYITDNTRKRGAYLKPEYAIHFIAYQPIAIGALNITAFPKFHDAADPHSFIIAHNNVTVGIFTDIGASCEHLIAHFKQCDAAFLEANYDAVMLENGRYPDFLKERIRSGHGHLSNEQALEVFVKHRSPGLTHLLLSHLSKDNNCKQLVKTLFEKHSINTEIIIASREEETGVFYISKKESTVPVVKVRKAPVLFQPSLF